MKDLLEKILKYLPGYLMDFGSLFCGPKRFMAEKNAHADEMFGQSLLFLGVSLALCVIMTAPFLPPGKDFWVYVGAKATTFLVCVSVTAIALHFAWRIVGGKASIRSFFITYAYFFSVIVVIFVFFMLLGEGAFKVMDPELYAKVIEAQLKHQPLPNLSENWVPVISFSFLILGVFFASVWLFFAWGAYRELNGLSKTRSFVAFVIMGVLNLPIFAIVDFVGSAMM